MSKAPKPVALNLRLPSGLHKRLTRAAAESHRSLNAEILARLNDSLVSKWSEVEGSVEIKEVAQLLTQKDEFIETVAQRLKRLMIDEWPRSLTPRESEDAARNSMTKKSEK